MNHKTVAVIGTFILAIGLSTACSSTSNNHDVHSSVKADVKASEKDQAAAPSLTAQIVKQEGDRVQIQFQVTNLTLSAEHYGKKQVPGEGHLHVMVDGVKKEGVTRQAPITIENLSPGKHTIALDLQKNDHTPYNVEKAFDIEVKKP